MLGTNLIFKIKNECNTTVMSKILRSGRIFAKKQQQADMFLDYNVCVTTGYSVAGSYQCFGETSNFWVRVS
jgi:hypothetical protein